MPASDGKYRHCVSIRLRSFSRDAGSVSFKKASPAPSGPGDDVTDALPPTADSRECTPESQALAADGQRITIVRQQQHVRHRNADVLCLHWLCKLARVELAHVARSFY